MTTNSSPCSGAVKFLTAVSCWLPHPVNPSKTELADTDESAAAVTDTFLSWGGIPNYAQQMTIFAQAYGKESFSVIDTITGAATPSENGTTATTVSTAKSDAPIQIETITLTTWGETEQDAYVPENSIS